MKLPNRLQPSTRAASSRSNGMFLKKPHSSQMPSGSVSVQCAITSASSVSAMPSLTKKPYIGIASSSGGNM